MDFIVIVKPDGYARHIEDKVIKAYENRLFKIKKYEHMNLTQEFVQQLYIEHADKYFYKDLCNFMISGKVLVIHMYGNINIAREVCLALRAKYANNMIFRENVVHCSEEKNAAIEIKLLNRQ